MLTTSSLSPANDIAVCNIIEAFASNTREVLHCNAHNQLDRLVYLIIPPVQGQQCTSQVQLHHIFPDLLDRPAQGPVSASIHLRSWTLVRGRKQTAVATVRWHGRQMDTVKKVNHHSAYTIDGQLQLECPTLWSWYMRQPQGKCLVWLTGSCRWSSGFNYC